MDEIHDVVVIGAGPAGAMASFLLSQQGLNVLLVERSQFPRYKVCGCCLSHNALEILSAHGLALDVQKHGSPITQFDLNVGKTKIELPLEPGIAISRADLDSYLVKKAQKNGTTFVCNTTAIVGQKEKDYRTVVLISNETTKKIAARIVVVCDGLAGSSLTDCKNMRPRIRKDSLIGLGQIIENNAIGKTFPVGHISMHLSKHGYIGLVHLGNGTVNIAAAIRSDFLKTFESPALAAQQLLAVNGIKSHLPIDGWKGTPALSRSRTIADTRLFVAGDAASYAEPFTGEGIAWALASAQLLSPLVAKAVSKWDDSLSSRWQQIYRKSIWSRQTLTSLLAIGLRRYELCSLLAKPLSTAPQLALPVLKAINLPILPR